jgi:uncharacterized protein with NAD-binding domain and iron-sulfur cluster
MNAGMGDTIFTPLYQVLRQRGVAIHFFHRVSNLALSADAGAIDAVSLYRQVDLVDGYDPLVPVESNGRVLACWPAQPKWDAIVGGAGIADEAWDLESMWCTHRAAGDSNVALERGKDFDLVVLGIPPAALKDIASGWGPRWTGRPLRDRRGFFGNRSRLWACAPVCGARLRHPFRLPVDRRRIRRRFRCRAGRGSC